MRIRYDIRLPEPKGTVQEVVRAIQAEAARRVVETLQATAPVESGRFVAMLRVEPTTNGASIRSDVPYAVYVRRRKGAPTEAQRAEVLFRQALKDVLAERADDISDAIVAEALKPLEGGRV